MKIKILLTLTVLLIAAIGCSTPTELEPVILDLKIEALYNTAGFEKMRISGTLAQDNIIRHIFINGQHCNFRFSFSKLDFDAWHYEYFNQAEFTIEFLNGETHTQKIFYR